MCMSVCNLLSLLLWRTLGNTEYIYGGNQIASKSRVYCYIKTEKAVVSSRKKGDVENEHVLTRGECRMINNVKNKQLSQAEMPLKRGRLGKPQCKRNNTVSVLVIAKTAHGRQRTGLFTAPQVLTRPAERRATANLLPFPYLKNIDPVTVSSFSGVIHFQVTRAEFQLEFFFYFWTRPLTIISL